MYVDSSSLLIQRLLTNHINLKKLPFRRNISIFNPLQALSEPLRGQICIDSPLGYGTTSCDKPCFACLPVFFKKENTRLTATSRMITNT